MVRSRELSNLGALAFVMQEQPTLRKALESVGRYLRLQNEALHMRIEETEGIVVIREDVLEGFAGDVRQAMQVVLGVLHRTLTTILGGSWKPKAVCFTHAAPSSIAMYERVFNAPVLFKQDFDGLICRASDLEVEIPAYDPVMAQQVRRHLDMLLAQSNATMADQVRKLVVTLLPSGMCSLDRVAQHLGVSRRTVSSHLAHHGQSYMSIVDDVREDMVMGYLAHTTRPVSEVATLVGFSSLSAFSRWFGNRFGSSVSEWRRTNADKVVSANEGEQGAEPYSSASNVNAAEVPAILQDKDLPDDLDSLRAVALHQNRLARALGKELEGLKRKIARG